MGVGPAAAKMTADRCLDVVRSRIRQLREKRSAAHHQAGSTKAALHGIMFNEGLLYRMERVTLRKALDGRHLAVTDINRKQHAGVDGGSVKPDRTCGAGTAIAGHLRSSQAKRVAQNFGEGHTRRHR